MAARNDTAAAYRKWIPSTRREEDMRRRPNGNRSASSAAHESGILQPAEQIGKKIGDS